MANYRKLGNDLFIGPQPSAEDLEAARQEGVRTVIDFRLPSETATPNAELVRGSGLTYVNVPVNKAALSEQQIDALDAAMHQNEGPYLLHCATGTRAALLLALSRAKCNGWTAERTFQEAEAMGFNLQGFPEFDDFVHKITGN